MRLANDILDLFSRVADGVQSEDDERRLVTLLKTDAIARDEFQRGNSPRCSARSPCSRTMRTAGSFRRTSAGRVNTWRHA